MPAAAASSSRDSDSSPLRGAATMEALSEVRDDTRIQITLPPGARRTPVRARLALAGQAQHSAFARPEGNFHVEAPASGKLDTAPPAPQHLVERHEQLGLDIVAGNRDAYAASSASAGPPRGPSEERAEEVAEAPHVLPLARIDGSPFSPGRGCEVHAALPVLAESVVFGALVRIAQDFVGLVDLLEPLGGLGPLGRGLQVGMVLPGELSIGPFDLLGCRGARHAQHLVVVAELYRHGLAGSSSLATTTWAGRSNPSSSRQPRRTSRATVPGSTSSEGTVPMASWSFGSKGCPTVSTGIAPASRRAFRNRRWVAATPS